MKKYFIEEIIWSFKFYDDMIHLDVDMPEFLTTPYDTVTDAKSVVDELVRKNMFVFDNGIDDRFDHIREYVIVACELDPEVEVDSDYILENYEDIDEGEFVMAVLDEMKEIICIGE